MQARLRSLLPLTLALSLAGASVSSFHIPQAWADDNAKIKAVFQEGLQLEAGGNFSGALAKFQEAVAIKRTPNILFHISFCQEKLGQLVSALGGYRIVILEGGDDPKNAKAVQAAQEALASLEKKIPSLTIKRGKGADLAKVTLDGVEVGTTALGKPQQVDPGPHSIEATQAGRLPFKEVIQLAEGETKSLEVVMKDKPEDKPPPPGPSAAGSSDGASVGNDDLKKLAKPSVLPYAVMGVGAASLVASGVFFYMRSSASSDLDAKCRGNVCPESAKSISDRGKSSTLLGNITLGLGVVGVGVGAVLLLTSKPAEKTTARRSVDLLLHPGPSGGGASLVGTF